LEFRRVLFRNNLEDLEHNRGSEASQQAAHLEGGPAEAKDDIDEKPEVRDEEKHEHGIRAEQEADRVVTPDGPRAEHRPRQSDYQEPEDDTKRLHLEGRPLRLLIADAVPFRLGSRGSGPLGRYASDPPRRAPAPHPKLGGSPVDEPDDRLDQPREHREHKEQEHPLQNAVEALGGEPVEQYEGRDVRERPARHPAHLRRLRRWRLRRHRGNEPISRPVAPLRPIRAPRGYGPINP